MSGTTEPARRGRRRPAAASRVLVTGLSISTALGLLAAIDPGPPQAHGAAVAPSRPGTTLARGPATPGQTAGSRRDQRPAPVARSHASR
jgi:hypothetical protein